MTQINTQDTTERTNQLDAAYLAWMDAENREQAAKVLLGVNDSIAMRAAYEVAVETVEEAKAQYYGLLDVARESEGLPSLRRGSLTAA